MSDDRTWDYESDGYLFGACRDCLGAVEPILLRFLEDFVSADLRVSFEKLRSLESRGKWSI